MSWYVILASFIGTIAFSVLYNIPPKYLLACGLIGILGWITYAFLSPLTGLAVAIFAATVVVTFLARSFAVIFKTAEIVFLISGIFTLVPGADLYWTVYYIVYSVPSKALLSGSNAFKTCIAMLLGIVIVHEIPEKFFHLLKGKKNETR